YLGVTASARGLAWRDRLDPAAAKTAAAISQRHGLPELLGRVLASRGIGLDEVATALDPTIKALMPDPSSLRDMEKGAARLAAAGVTFLLVVATLPELKRRGAYGADRSPPDLLALLDLVALATVCDVVPLKGLNRAYVMKGLQAMRLRRNAGLRALVDAAGL